MKKNKFYKIVLAAILSVFSAIFVSCAKEEITYDESGFTGSGLSNRPNYLDMIGYGDLYSDYYEYGDDGSVVLRDNFFAPLRDTSTEEGFSVSASIERADGVFDVMTELWNTGALCVKCGVLEIDEANYVTVPLPMYRIFVVGVDDMTSNIVISGKQAQMYDKNVFDYSERRYPIPLGNYCTGAPIDIKLSYFDGAYSVTVTTQDGTTVSKRIDESTAYIENPSYSADLTAFFEAGTKRLGISSMDLKAKFSNVSFEIGNEKAQSYFGEDLKQITLQNNAPEGGSISVSNDNPQKGENVTVNIQPKNGWYVHKLFVNGINYKHLLSLEKNGYEYELLGVQTDTLVKVELKEGTEQKYTVSGTYSYTSGEYNAHTGKIENNEDVLSIRAGVYSGVVEDGLFFIDLPDGEHIIEISSEKFPTTKKHVVVCGEDMDVGDIAFKRLNFTQPHSYNSDDSLTFSALSTKKVFDEIPADEGFVVNYTVVGAASNRWFNTGGLYMVNENGSFDYIFVFQTDRGKSSAKAQIVLIESTLRKDNGPTLATTYSYSSVLEPLQVTIAYYQGEFHIILDGAYTCTINENTTLDTAQGKLDENFFKAKPRSLGLRNYDSAATFTDVSYLLGDEAAKKVIAEKNVPVQLTTTGAGVPSMSTGGNEVALNSVQGIGTTMIATLTPENGNIIKEFTVNGTDMRSALTGPFTIDGKQVYKYVFKTKKGGAEIVAEFAQDTQTLYKVSGDYSYDGVDAGNLLSVYVGDSYAGTIANGTFEIELPVGTHILTISDGKNYVTKEVCVGADMDMGTLTFTAISLEIADGGVTQSGSNITIENTGTGKNFHPLSGPVVAAEGFTVSYTVSAKESSAWYNTGAFYFEKNGTTYSIMVLVQKGKAVIGLQQPDVGGSENASYKYTPYVHEKTSVPLKVTIVYYNETIYIQLGEGDEAYQYVIGIDNFTDGRIGYSEEISSEFFSAGYRKLGFRTMATASTFQNITYQLGNDKALETVQTVFGGVAIS